MTFFIKKIKMKEVDGKEEIDELVVTSMGDNNEKVCSKKEIIFAMNLGRTVYTMVKGVNGEKVNLVAGTHLRIDQQYLLVDDIGDVERY